MLCGLIRLCLVWSLIFGFSVLTSHSPFLRLFLFISYFPWYRCAELVSWILVFSIQSFVFFLLAGATCLCLFSLWGVSYLLAGGCSFGDLSMCLSASWWLRPSVIILPLTCFLGSFVGVWSQSFVFGDCFVSDFIFLTFSNHCLLWPKYFMVRWDKLVFVLDLLSAPDLYWVSVIMTFSVFFFFVIVEVLGLDYVSALVISS